MPMLDAISTRGAVPTPIIASGVSRKLSTVPSRAAAPANSQWLDSPSIRGVTVWVMQRTDPQPAGHKADGHTGHGKEDNGELDALDETSSVATLMPGMNITQGTRARIHSPLKPVRLVVSSKDDNDRDDQALDLSRRHLP